MSTNDVSSMDKRWMLTTVDNPFDPFDQFDEWYNYDESSGYHSSSLLARIEMNSEDLSDADQELVHNQAIDEIVTINASGVHKKVSKTFGSSSSISLEDSGS